MSCLVGQGLIPCSPWALKLAVSTHVLEMFRVACLRCPTLMVHSWIKTLSDLHGIAFKPYRDSERPDPRTAGAGGDYFLSREKVDLWAKEVLAQHVKVPVSDDPQEDSECRERWKNMSEELTSKMWSIFDETSVFLALCRHGFVLLVADMVRSGELAKYGLAIFDALMDAFGAGCGLGYDIGCGSETTIKNSPLGPEANLLRFKMLVGAFYGHAHNRKCQLRFLATYVKGLGLEDLEGCERLFSRLNALSKSVRYASVFHRRQLIAMYLEHLDTYETYANLSTFLVNNYKQAVEILDTQESLEFAMGQAGISGPHVFEERLAQEKAYQRSLKQRRIRWSTTSTLSTWMIERSKANGTAKRHTRENYDKALAAVQESERKLDVATRWTPDSKEWADAARLVSTRRYRICVDRLELLVVKRLFELTKMNMSQTGYKLRRHIAKALQVRSKPIHNALNRYNLAAKALNPPRRTLSWAEVINYTFLSGFDILWDADGNAALRPWATPGAWQLMDSYFKIERAKEEIQRLNIEIRRFVTYMRDEREFLVKKEAEVRAENPDLAFFRGRFDNIHMRRLEGLKKKLGPRFTGTLVPGVCRAPVATVAPVAAVASVASPDKDIVMEDAEEGPSQAEWREGIPDELDNSGESEDDWVDEDSEDDGDVGKIAEGEALSEVIEQIGMVTIDRNDE
ncbi:hypothetical protein B0H11DRAFT_2180943 [Mycena galericulata]|nr:hypothetical protein B0H11DRAFT_2180943 [Mycena galericulata]